VKQQSIELLLTEKRVFRRGRTRIEKGEFREKKGEFREKNGFGMYAGPRWESIGRCQYLGRNNLKTLR
jgi:hypothetical protein